MTAAPVFACVIDAAPTPALVVWRGTDGVAWTANAKARRIIPASPQLAVLARAVMGQAESAAAPGPDAASRGQIGLPGLDVEWTSHPCDAAWIAWLQVRRHGELPDGERLARALGTGIWTVDLQAGRCTWSELMRAQYGLRPGDADPTPAQWLGMLEPQFRDRLAAILHDPPAGVRETELRWTQPDGSVHWLYLRAGAHPDRKVWAGISVDMTVRIEAAERLRPVRDRAAVVAELLGIGTWEWIGSEQRTVWDERNYRLRGLQPDDPRPVSELRESTVHPDDRERVRRIRQSTTLSNPDPSIPYDARFRIVRPDGMLRWLESRWIASRDPHGRGLHAIGMTWDVTAVHEAEQRLRQLHERLLLAVDSLGFAFWEHDFATGDTRWDDQMYRLRGLQPNDPRSLRKLRMACVHPEDREGLERDLEALGSSQGSAVSETPFRIVRPDGSVRWLMSRARRIAGPDADPGRVGRVVGVQWDVTESKVAEQAIRERELARQASRAKSDFLGRMSHEMRTPLNAVIGFAQLLEDDPMEDLSPAQLRKLQHIQRAGEHLLALIDDTRDLTSIEAGTLSCHPEPVAVAPVVAECIQWIERVAERANVRLLCPEIRGSVTADPRRLRQVLINLLSNAVKYNQAGGWVEIRTVESDGGDWLGLQVRDNGRGMGEEQRARLFRPYDRLGAEQTPVDGTGLGLSITRHLVDRMGGRMEAHSLADVGSSFCVWLQAIAAPVRPPDDASSDAEAADSDAQEGRVLQLLCIDDDPVNGLLIEKVVSMRRGVRLHLARDGTSGLELARRLQPQVVLLDLRLPDLNGFEVYRCLQAEPGLRDTQFIVLSASVAAEDMARARDAGFADYWTKPIQVTQFLTRLDSLSDRFAVALGG